MTGYASLSWYPLSVTFPFPIDFESCALGSTNSTRESQGRGTVSLSWQVLHWFGTSAGPQRSVCVCAGPTAIKLINLQTFSSPFTVAKDSIYFLSLVEEGATLRRFYTRTKLVGIFSNKHERCNHVLSNNNTFAFA